MSTISNYFNTCSSEMTSLKDFKSSECGQKIGMAILTALVIIFSLKLFARPVLRLLDKNFKQLDRSNLALAANKTSQSAERQLLTREYIPVISDVQKMPLKDVHEIWKRNNELLLGIIANVTIPKFGFHGTSAKGMEGILKTKQAISTEGNEIYVAGYQYQLDPIAFLGDLYTIAAKASNYEDPKGGIFTVTTEKARSLHKYIYSTLGGYPLLDDCDGEQDKKFLKFFYRNNNQEEASKITADDIDQADGTLKTKSLSPAVEMLLEVVPENFETRVHGVFAHEDRIYTRDSIKQLEDMKYGNKYHLALRFMHQELILDAFAKLKVVDPISLKHDLRKYQLAGANLMNEIDTVAKITAPALHALDPHAVGSINHCLRKLNDPKDQ